MQELKPDEKCSFEFPINILELSKECLCYVYKLALVLTWETCRYDLYWAKILLSKGAALLEIYNHNCNLSYRFANANGVEHPVVSLLLPLMHLTLIAHKIKKIKLKIKRYLIQKFLNVENFLVYP